MEYRIKKIEKWNHTSYIAQRKIFGAIWFPLNLAIYGDEKSARLDIDRAKFKNKVTYINV
jgi:hypothetical protein